MTPTTPALVALLAANPLADPGPVFPGQVSEQAVVWNGFEHAWSYNHRLSRLGDFVGGVRCVGGACSAPLVHAAATGSGSDVARYRARAAVVEAPGVGFLQGSTTFHAKDATGEGETQRFRREIQVPAAGLLAGRTHLDVVLGGFDVRSEADPDKLAGLTIGVGEARYTADGNVRFDVDAALTMDCDSLECDRFDRGVDYDLSVVWTVFAADDQVAVTDRGQGVDYAWTRGRHELDGERLASRGVIAGLADQFQTAFVAFRRLAIELDDDHHLQEWSTLLEAGAYDPAAGIQDLAVDLFFKQWNRLTRARVFSYADRGHARLSADVALVQVREGSSRAEEVNGALGWRADGGPADPTRSLAVRVLPVSGSP